MIMALTETEKTALVNEVLNRIKAGSQSVDELETVSTLSGITSLPAMRGTDVVSAPLTLLSKPADDAAKTANAAATAASKAATLAEGAAETANENAGLAQTAADDANEAAAAANLAASSYEGTSLAALKGATARFEAIVESGTVKQQSTVEAGGRVVWLRSAKNFVYEVGGSYYNNWSVEGVPSASLYHGNGFSLLKDKSYICGDTLYVWSDEEGDLVAASGGSGTGSGFYNVTQLHPLTSGYYTKATAVAALSGADIDDEAKPGMVITFEAGAGKWLDYRFEGTDISSFLTPSAWNRYGGGDAVKKIKVTKGTATSELSPDGEGTVNLDIPVMEIDETLDGNSTNPVENKAVAAEFKKLGGKYGAALQLNEIGAGDEKAYSLSLLDENGEVLSTSDQFTGGGGGSVSANKIVLTRVTANPTVKLGDTVRLVYTYDHVDTSTGESTGNPAKALVTISRGANSSTLESALSAGSSNSVDVTKYLGTGTNTVRVRVTVGEGSELQVSQITWTVTVVQLVLSSSFNVAAVVNRGDTVSVPFALTGSGEKTLRCYVDGVDTEDRTIGTSNANTTSNLMQHLK